VHHSSSVTLLAWFSPFFIVPEYNHLLKKNFLEDVHLDTYMCLHARSCSPEGSRKFVTKLDYRLSSSAVRFLLLSSFRSWAILQHTTLESFGRSSPLGSSSGSGIEGDRILHDVELDHVCCDVHAELWSRRYASVCVSTSSTHANECVCVCVCVC
jgi:hypothetical protein